MHLHGYLQDCIFNYGPVYSFWLFNCERENGNLGSYKANKKNIEVQLIKRLLKESWARENEFNNLLGSLPISEGHMKGSTRLCIFLKSSSNNSFFVFHTLIMCSAVPKNKLCVGSIGVILTGSKYTSSKNEEYLVQ
jgi:hypothetical protein